MKTENLPIHHIALKVWNLDKCKKFYSEVLGLALVSEQRDSSEAIRSVWLKSGSITLMLERASDMAGAKSETLGWHLVAFEIPKDKREEWKKKLKDRGVIVTHETEYSLFFRDPEGNRLALSHHPHKTYPSREPEEEAPKEPA